MAFALFAVEAVDCEAFYALQFRGKSHSAGQEARSRGAAGWDGSGDVEARLVVLAAGHRASPSGAARSGRMRLF